MLLLFFHKMVGINNASEVSCLFVFFLFWRWNCIRIVCYSIINSLILIPWKMLLFNIVVIFNAVRVDRDFVSFIYFTTGSNLDVVRLCLCLVNVSSRLCAFITVDKCNLYACRNCRCLNLWSVCMWSVLAIYIIFVIITLIYTVHNCRFHKT